MQPEVHPTLRPTQGVRVIHRTLSHVRNNAVAYLALVFSVIGGGGGYAVAATTHHGSAKKTRKTAIAACASKKTGELFLHRHGGKCAKGRHKVSWSVKGPKGARGVAGAAGAAGAPAPSIHGIFDAQSGVAFPGSQGATATATGLGTFSIVITDPACSQGINVPTVTPFDSYDSGGPAVPPGAVPVAWLSDSGSATQFILHTGFVSNGAFTADGVRFALVDGCTTS
jgi:hypothetical protein